MKTGTLVAATTISGILGGIIGAMLVPKSEPSVPPGGVSAGGTAASEASDRSEPLAKEIAALRARLEEMQASVATTSQDAARLRTEVETDRKAAAVARTKADSLERPGLARSFGEALQGGFVEGATMELPIGHFALSANGASPKMKKTLELLAKPEAERWTAIRDGLGLSASQEEELKAAIKERDQSISEMTKIENHDVSDENGVTTVAMKISAPDPEKVKEARRRYDDRVNGALSTDQAKKWRDDGYEGAAGGGGSHSMVFTSVQTIGDEPAK